MDWKLSLINAVLSDPLDSRVGAQTKPIASCKLHSTVVSKVSKSVECRFYYFKNMSGILLQSCGETLLKLLGTLDTCVK